MKLLTFHGPGRYFEVPGHFTLEAGQSRKIDDDLADTLVNANPRVELTTEPCGKRGEQSQPEAGNGEGQPIEPNGQEE